MTTIRKFPLSHWQRLWNKRGSRAVNCVVSERWLRFGEPGRPDSGYLPSGKIGTPVTVDVMTSSGDEEETRKLCSLVITYEELKAMVDRLASEIEDKSVGS